MITPAPGCCPHPSEPAFRVGDPRQDRAPRKLRRGLHSLSPVPEKLGVLGAAPPDHRPWGGAGEARRKGRAGGRGPTDASPFRSGGRAAALSSPGLLPPSPDHRDEQPRGVFAFADCAPVFSTSCICRHLGTGARARCLTGPGKSKLRGRTLTNGRREPQRRGSEETNH